jgi:hypothetical protein
MYTLVDIIKSIDEEIDYGWKEIEQEKALRRFKSKEIKNMVRRIGDLIVAKERLVNIGSSLNRENRLV